MKPSRIARIVLILVSASLLGACASGPRQSEGLSWVVAQEEERRRLQAMGFPQYALD